MKLSLCYDLMLAKERVGEKANRQAEEDASKLKRTHQEDFKGGSSS